MNNTEKLKYISLHTGITIFELLSTMVEIQNKVSLTIDFLLNKYMNEIHKQQISLRRMKIEKIMSIINGN
jgi:hypothetical protein